MIENLGGQSLSLSDWIESGYDETFDMGLFIPSAKIMERLARGARRDFRDGFLARVGALLNAGTVEQMAWALSEPLADTGFQRLKNDVGAAARESVFLAARKVAFVAENAGLSPEDYRSLSPLIYLHINPYGRFEVDLDKRIDFERMVA